MRFSPSPLTLVFVLCLATPAVGQRQHIAPTDPLSPADERKTFKLPPGFEAQLVAAEPDIGKPIQSAFDARGRLWVTTSRHYPFAADEDEASDKIYVLSDFGPDGKAGKVTVFADSLNIPIGVLPLPDCDSCLASSVGEIVKLTDTDGDGKADKKETILSGFGTKDTHGMYNSFRLLPDGWVYACHGFSNTSTVTAKDGSTITMNSGNTFRFRPDGSRVEPWTFGQVNPFGMTLDPHGNLYTADCHSKPITQLIRGATYQSFSKPHDGLGFAPHVTPHSHGSTALCGLAWYAGDGFPAAYQNCLFLGNVVTNRVNADRITFHGSTPVAEELPDFLVSSDPWFRPTDVQLGPDGALYVCDFYNRIIGHYEVDLKHPGRDRDRGRVWRIVWKGEPGVSTPSSSTMPALTNFDEVGLTKALAGPNLTVRMLAAQQLLARFPNAAAKRFAPMSAEDARKQLSSDDAMAVRAAVELLTGSPDSKNVIPLGDLIIQCPASDTHLKHAALVALRNSYAKALADINAENVVMKWATNGENELAKHRTLADAALGIHNWNAAMFTGIHLAGYHGEPNPSRVPDLAYHYSRYWKTDQLGRWLRRHPDAPTAIKVAALIGQARGTMIRGGKLSLHTYMVAEQLVADGQGGDLANMLARLRPDEPVPNELFPKLSVTAVDAGVEAQARQAAIEACSRIDLVRAYPIMLSILRDQGSPPSLRNAAIVGLAGSPDATHIAAVVDPLAAAPADTIRQAAPKLATTKVGAEAIIKAITLGKLSPRLLQDKAILERLRAANINNLDARVAELTRGLPPADQQTADLIRTRTAAFAKAKADPKAGLAVFTKTCAACHQVGDIGKKIAPQLDGIGNRGLDRLVEDILDPSRNVDAAFRTRVLNLVDGRTVSGAFVRIDGAVWVLANEKGEEVRVSLKDVESWKHSPLSPMPANVGETVPEPDFYHLIAFLLDQRAKDEEK